MAKSVTIEDAVALLNQALALSPAAVSSLTLHRVRCGDVFDSHPTITVGGEARWLGLLGLLNGIFGTVAERIGVVVEGPPDVVTRFLVLSLPDTVPDNSVAHLSEA